MKLYLTLLALFFYGVSISQPFPTGKSLLDKVDQNMSSHTRIVRSQMEIHTPRRTRTLELKTWSQGNEKAFTEYLAPPRERGTKMLKLDNQLWIYSPSTDRIIQISGHMLRQSVMGSDMSFEDMMENTPLLEMYNAEVTSEEIINGRPCWLITLTAKQPQVNYQIQKMWVDKERFCPLKIEMYSKSNQLLKRMELDQVQRIQGRWFPMRIHYKDMLKEGKGTVMTILDIQFDVSIPETIFSKASLR